MDEEIKVALRNVFQAFFVVSMLRHKIIKESSEEVSGEAQDQAERKQIEYLGILLCYRDHLPEVLVQTEMALVESVAQRIKWSFAEDAYPEGIDNQQSPKTVNWMMCAEQAEFFEELEESAVRQTALLQPSPSSQGS